MYHFQILDSKNISEILPLVFELNERRIPIDTLKERFNNMIHENYECAVIKLKDEIIGVTGLWYCTRHYIGKSVELDHVFIIPEHRGNGLGQKFMDWIEKHLEKQEVLSLELNTYVQNYPSHKFYYNQGFEIKGYHFLKKL